MLLSKWRRAIELDARPWPMNVFNLPENLDEKHDRRRATFNAVSPMKIIETHLYKCIATKRVHRSNANHEKAEDCITEENYSMRKQNEERTLGAYMYNMFARLETHDR